MTALLLVLTTSVAPITVAAKSLVKNSRILVVAGIGTDQELELYYWHQRPSPLDHTSSDRVFFNYHYFRNAVTDVGVAGGDEQCAGTVQATVQARRGFNTLKVRMGAGNESLLINGKEVDLPNKCLMDAKRVVVAVADPVGVDRAFDAEFALQLARHFSPLGHSIVNPDGSTAASIGLDLPQKFLVFEDEVGDS